MSWQHLRAILWLRWRISLNQLRRSGVLSAVILAILGVSAIVTSVSMFFVALLVGAVTLPDASPETVMLVWDGIVVAFLFFWIAGLVTELQRSEVLSLQKLLHLPISLAGTFFINYLGSLLSLSLIVFLPGMVGLCIALTLARGPANLLLFPLLASFLLMVTALTYQFQGWLAALMVNKKKRRTVIAVVTVCFVLISQAPNLLNNVFWNERGDHGAFSAELQDSLTRLDRSRAAGEISTQQYLRLREAAQKDHKLKVDEQKRVRWERVVLVAARINPILPVGWLPYGAMSCVRGKVWPAILGVLGAALIGMGSLWRSYRTTLRLYTGQLTSRAPRRRAAPIPAKPLKPDARFFEKRLPGLSEHATAVALVTYRSLTRAPEAKMVLLTPVIMLVVFGSMLLTGQFRPPEAARPFMGLAALGITLLSLLQLLGNQFAIDRDGFRALVLSPSSRRDILLGKNLSVAPLALGLGALMIAVVQALYPMRIDHLLATLAELASTYLIFCVVANFTSIIAPQPLASGSLKPVHPKAMAVLVQFLFLLLLPVLIGLSVIPLGVELLLHHFGRLGAVPIYLLCSLPELAIVVWLYGYILSWQGRMLQAREQRILDVVTTKVE